MIYDILFEKCPWHTRVALFDEAGRLMTVHFDDDDRVYVEGAVVLGRVRKILPGLNAVFVDIGDIEDGFLPFKSIPKSVGKLTEGQELMVRVTSARRTGKGARLDARVIEDRPNEDVKIPYIVKRPPSALSRTLMDAGQHPVRVWVLDARHYDEVAELVPDDKIFRLDEHPDVDLLEQLDEQMDALSGDVFPIAGGGKLSIERTKALTAIDVDSSTFKGSGKEPLQVELNTYAANEIVRLIRLLDISGNVIVDFLTMPRRRDRRKIREYVIELFNEQDLRKTEVLDMSRFGLLEINRERSGETIAVLLRTPLFVAGEILLSMWRNTRQTYVIECSRELADVLNTRLTNAVCLTHFGKAVDIKVNNNFAAEEFKLSSL